jgi:hypothetical protein
VDLGGGNTVRRGTVGGFSLRARHVAEVEGRGGVDSRGTSLIGLRDLVLEAILNSGKMDFSF